MRGFCGFIIILLHRMLMIATYHRMVRPYKPSKMIVIYGLIDYTIVELCEK